MACRKRALLVLTLAGLGMALVGGAGGAQESTCGDINGDRRVAIADAVYLLNFLFLGGPSPKCASEGGLSCANVNFDAAVNLSDVAALLNWLFLGGGELRCGNGAVDVEGFTFLWDNEQGFPEYGHNRTGIVFVLLPGGSFLMGAQGDDPEGPNFDPTMQLRADEEGPVHEVVLSPFLIGKFEVTQAEWEEVMGGNPSFFTEEQSFAVEDTSRLPVEQVSWNDIQVFEERAGLALPTEAQWEYACRAGTQTPFSGTGRIEDMGWCPFFQTFTVGEKEPNQFGLHDMHGNVEEWCEDVYARDSYQRAQAVEEDPLNTSGNRALRVVRGGAWVFDAHKCRSSSRGADRVSSREGSLGFRAARSLR